MHRLPVLVVAAASLICSTAVTAQILAPLQPPTPVPKAWAFHTPGRGIQVQWKKQTTSPATYLVQRSSDGVNYVTLQDVNGRAYEDTTQWDPANNPWYRVIAHNDAGSAAPTAVRTQPLSRLCSTLGELVFAEEAGDTAYPLQDGRDYRGVDLRYLVVRQSNFRQRTPYSSYEFDRELQLKVESLETVPPRASWVIDLGTPPDPLSEDCSLNDEGIYPYSESFSMATDADGLVTFRHTFHECWGPDSAPVQGSYTPDGLITFHDARGKSWSRTSHDSLPDVTVQTSARLRKIEHEDTMNADTRRAGVLLASPADCGF